MKIPKKFKLFGTIYKIIWDNKRLNDRSEYGLTDYRKTLNTDYIQIYNEAKRNLKKDPDYINSSDKQKREMRCDVYKLLNKSRKQDGLGTTALMEFEWRLYPNYF